MSRCLSQVADHNSQFSLDAARSGSSLLEWVPFNIENGNDKINNVIDEYKGKENIFHSESTTSVKGVTLNCLRLYHSDELDKLVPQLLVGSPNHNWYQDNP